MNFVCKLLYLIHNLLLKLRMLYRSTLQDVFGSSDLRTPDLIRQKPCKCYRVLCNLSLQPVLEFAISSTSMSVAPTPVKSSITVAIVLFSTIELTATQSAASSAVIVGARLPGVIFVAVWRSDLWTLYWHRTYFCAADGYNQCQDFLHQGKKSEAH